MSATLAIAAPTTPQITPHLALLRAAESFARALRESAVTIARDIDCSRATLAIIRTLDQRGPLPVSDIAQVLRVDTSVASRQVSLMCDEGLVERQIDPDDRRVRTIDLSERGRERTREIEAALELRMQEVFSGWSTDELTSAVTALDKVAQTIGDAAAEHHR